MTPEPPYTLDDAANALLHMADDHECCSLSCRSIASVLSNHIVGEVVGFDCKDKTITLQLKEMPVGKLGDTWTIFTHPYE